VVDNLQNLLVVHPDHLISTTVVGDSFTCIRKSVLQDRIKATSDASQATAYGHMLHEIFQEAMRSNRWDDEFMTSTIETICRRYLETLYEIQLEMPLAAEQLKARAADLQAWAEIFVSAKPNVSRPLVKMALRYAYAYIVKCSCKGSQWCSGAHVRQ